MRYKNPFQLVTYLIILVFAVYTGFLVMTQMTKALWELSIFSAIGFVISVAFGIYKGVFFKNGAINLKPLMYLFVGAVISFMAGSLVPTFVDMTFSGQLAIALIYLGVIVKFWFEAQRIKGLA